MLLSESELRSALEPLLDRLLIERLRYFQLQLEPRLQSLIEAALQPRNNAGSADSGIARLLQAHDPNQVFEIIFEETLPLVGSARGLLVLRQAEATLWRSQGLSLPERFPLARREQVLVGVRTHPIKVRDTTIGLLCWEGTASLPEATRAKLDTFVQAAGLVLLSQALPAPVAASVAAMAEAPASERRPAAAAERAGEAGRALRFAQLLFEDLELYLGRERPQELAAGRRQGDVATRFQPEIERCRRAFLERFPPSSGVATDLLEEGLQRLVHP